MICIGHPALSNSHLLGRTLIKPILHTLDKILKRVIVRTILNIFQPLSIVYFNTIMCQKCQLRKLRAANRCIYMSTQNLGPILIQKKESELLPYPFEAFRYEFVVFTYGSSVGYILCLRNICLYFSLR